MPAECELQGGLGAFPGERGSYCRAAGAVSAPSQCQQAKSISGDSSTVQQCCHCSGAPSRVNSLTQPAGPSLPVPGAPSTARGCVLEHPVGAPWAQPRGCTDPITQGLTWDRGKVVCSLLPSPPRQAPAASSLWDTGIYHQAAPPAAQIDTAQTLIYTSILPLLVHTHKSHCYPQTFLPARLHRFSPWH